MKLFSAGADAIPEPQTQNQTKKKYRLITVRKKQLPKSGSKGRNSVFWASVSIVGEDLGAIQQGLRKKFMRQRQGVSMNMLHVQNNY
jgi:hypothetical protein